MLGGRNVNENQGLVSAWSNNRGVSDFRGEPVRWECPVAIHKLICLASTCPVCQLEGTAALLSLAPETFVNPMSLTGFEPPTVATISPWFLCRTGIGDQPLIHDAVRHELMISMRMSNVQNLTLKITVPESKWGVQLFKQSNVGNHTLKQRVFNTY